MADQFRLDTLHRMGGSYQRERYTFDFVSDEVSLFEATTAFKLDICGALTDPKFELELARRLNKEAAAALTSDVSVGLSRRASLFICSECGDFACGAITARVSRTASHVRWTEFAYDNGYEPMLKLDVREFEFDWVNYLEEIRRALVL